MMMKGRIVQGRGGLYTVRDESGQEYVLRAKNKFRRAGITPLVGDEVEFSPGRLEEHGWLEDILPRSSLSLRPPVANITQILLVVATEPAPDFVLIDKLLVYAFEQVINPILLVNKTDLNPDLLNEIRSVYQATGIKILGISAVTGEGIEALEHEMKGEINCFAGQSGVGKSTLISKFTGLDLETGAVSERIRRGKQTTRHVSLIEHNGYQVLDTPGFSLLELPKDMEPSELKQYYPEFTDYEPDCRFEVCLHDQEPDCAVNAAVQNGSISPLRLERYLILLNHLRENWSKRYD